MRSTPSDELDLEAFFAGALSSDCGLRSWLGSFIEHGGRSAPSTASPPEPGGAALAAVRAERRIRETLLDMPVEHRAVLAAAFTPRPPVLEHVAQLGDLLPVVQLLDGPHTLDAVLALARRPRHPCRRLATSELRRMHSSAQRALQRALEAYSAAQVSRRARRCAARLAEDA